MCTDARWRRRVIRRLENMEEERFMIAWKVREKCLCSVEWEILLQVCWRRGRGSLAAACSCSGNKVAKIKGSMIKRLKPKHYEAAYKAGFSARKQSWDWYWRQRVIGRVNIWRSKPSYAAEAKKEKPVPTRIRLIDALWESNNRHKHTQL